MNTTFNTVPALEVKRRGVRAITDQLVRGPVHVIQRDRPAFVALSEESFQDMLGELETARIAASLADLAAGRIRKGSPADLMAEILVD